MQSYQFLFPFEKIPKGARILIYGAGNLGQDYLCQMLITNYAKVIGMVDQYAEKIPPMVVSVYKPTEIHTLEFDYVVIALRGKFGYKEIHRLLEAEGVLEEQIVYIAERDSIIPPIFLANIDIFKKNYAFHQTTQSIACYLNGGLGDFICQKKLLMSLMKLMPNAIVDLFFIQDENFLQVIYRDCNQISNLVLNMQKEYETVKNNYALSLSIYGAGYLKVDMLKEKAFSGDLSLLQKLRDLKEITDKEDYQPHLPGALMIQRNIFKGLNCYTCFSYGGIFPIQDKKISIKLLNVKSRFLDMLQHRKYITFNIGNGESADGKSIAKSWPIAYYQNFLNEFHRRYPDVVLIQIGASNAIPLKEATHHIFGKNFDFVGQVLKTAIFHLDIEGGMVHFASQLGTRCIVLYGPTQVSYFGYEQNINIHMGECQGCYSLYQDISRCARDLNPPSCMMKITPNIVLEHVHKFFESDLI